MHEGLRSDRAGASGRARWPDFRPDGRRQHVALGRARARPARHDALLPQRSRRGRDGGRLFPRHRASRRRDRHLRSRADAGRHFADGRGAQPHRDGAGDRRDPAGREEQAAIDGSAPLRRGVQHALSHHHQAGQRRRGDRRGVLYGARAALPGRAQPADGHPGALVRLGLRVSPLHRIPAARATTSPATRHSRRSSKR